MFHTVQCTYSRRRIVSQFMSKTLLCNLHINVPECLFSWPTQEAGYISCSNSMISLSPVTTRQHHHSQLYLHTATAAAVSSLSTAPIAVTTAVQSNIISNNWLGGVVVSASDSWSRGHGFDSRPLHYQVTILIKLFTPMCLCHQAVQFGTGQRAVMLWPCGTDFSGLSTYGLTATEREML